MATALDLASYCQFAQSKCWHAKRNPNSAATWHGNLIILPHDSWLKFPLFQFDYVSHPILGMNNPVANLEHSCTLTNSAYCCWNRRRDSGGSRLSLHEDEQRSRSIGGRPGYSH